MGTNKLAAGQTWKSKLNSSSIIILKVYDTRTSIRYIHTDGTKSGTFHVQQEVVGRCYDLVEVAS